LLKLSSGDALEFSLGALSTGDTPVSTLPDTEFGEPSAVPLRLAERVLEAPHPNAGLLPNVLGRYETQKSADATRQIVDGSQLRP
jgi:hypothetical protein